ncbi:asparaginase [Acuticoccus sp. I52.16.1]|uniref:asparaginase n=1 Tax=Acuticoccus sp. I52.16.1 TaxID=2928472 RepID=UPI001FD17B10|nr:asparaginase [Acuticoccus sp. I52.16.1]UOM34115.1 asparaginase [Acuticoccus sp. I52.16.1]
MPNPVICEVTRGGIVESVHRGAYAVVDGSGRVIAASGDVARPVFARSAMKLMQALVLVESGAADAAGFGTRALALAGASHSGEAGHVALAQEMLQRVGLTQDALGCGPQWPAEVRDAAAVLMSRGAPGRVHNNCSGKHAGFLATTRHLGADVATYLDPAHPVQRAAKAAVESLVGGVIAGDCCSIDGCSAPTFAMPLEGLARGFARLATGADLAPERAAAARRLMQAAMAEPWLVAGTGRLCTALMQAAPGHVYAKTGAEGVYVAAFPHCGVALALKCDDGGTRAAEALVAALTLRHGGLPDEAAASVAAMARRPVADRNGHVVGEIRGVVAR